MTDDTGRRLSRDELAAAHGYSRTTLERLWADRAANGHPDAHRDGRTLTWDAAEWAAWDHSRQDLITGAEFARLLGHRDSSWVSKAATVPPEGFPAPVEWGDPVNRRRPKWRRSDAQHYADNRPSTRPPPAPATAPAPAAAPPTPTTPDSPSPARSSPTTPANAPPATSSACTSSCPDPPPAPGPKSCRPPANPNRTSHGHRLPPVQPDPPRRTARPLPPHRRPPAHHLLALRHGRGRTRPNRPRPHPSHRMAPQPLTRPQQGLQAAESGRIRNASSLHCQMDCHVKRFYSTIVV